MADSIDIAVLLKEVFPPTNQEKVTRFQELDPREKKLHIDMISQAHKLVAKLDKLQQTCQ
jgi:hypothetical protein